MKSANFANVTGTLFGIFFAMLLKHASGEATEGIYLHTRSDGKLYLARLKAKTKVRDLDQRHVCGRRKPVLTRNTSFSPRWIASPKLAEATATP